MSVNNKIIVMKFGGTSQKFSTYQMIRDKISDCSNCSDFSDKKFVIDFFKNGPKPAPFSSIFVFFKHTLQFFQQINVKNGHPVYGTGFEPTTFGT